MSTSTLRRFGAVSIFALAFAALAADVPPVEVTIDTPPGVTVKVSPRKGNTSAQVLITVNAHDRVVTKDGRQVYPVLPPTPEPPPPPPPPVTPPDMSKMGPQLDPAKIPPPAVGYATARIRTAWQDPLGWYDPTLGDQTKAAVGCTGWSDRCKRPLLNPSCESIPESAWTKNANGDTVAGPNCLLTKNLVAQHDATIGAFRTPCKLGAIRSDDPIVRPDAPGTSHAHAFYGPPETNASSKQDGSDLVGRSTCAGGSLFQSRLWVPVMVDTTDGSPVIFDLNYYQKGSYKFDISGVVQPLPWGLRMIAGDPTNTDPAKSGAQYTCIGADAGAGPWRGSIPDAIADGHCTAGARFFMSVGFPNCVAVKDGKPVLDSPDHRAHLSDPIRDAGGVHCPATHPFVIAVVSYQLSKTLSDTDKPSAWRLSSDMDPNQKAGTSGHGDYEAHVDPTLEATITQKCIRERRNGNDFLTCDGRMLY